VLKTLFVHILVIIFIQDNQLTSSRPILYTRCHCTSRSVKNRLVLYVRMCPYGRIPLPIWTLLSVHLPPPRMCVFLRRSFYLYIYQINHQTEDTDSFNLFHFVFTLIVGHHWFLLLITDYNISLSFCKGEQGPDIYIKVTHIFTYCINL
jgi:hypothetical protein